MAKDIFYDLIYTDKVNQDSRTENQYRDQLNNLKYEFPIVKPFYQINFKKPLSVKRKFYSKLIENEVIKYFNSFIKSFDIETTEEEYFFLYKKYFNKYSQYLRNINEYIKTNDLTEKLYTKPTSHPKSDEAYILFFLKANAIMLFIELQERFSNYSTNEILTKEEIYEIFFNEDLPKNSQLIRISKQEVAVKDAGNLKMKKKKKSFGYKHNDSQNLLDILKRLQLKIDLIDEDISTIEKFQELLLSPNFIKFDIKIRLLCETTQFRYIVDKLKPHFNNLTPTSIEESGKFYTKNNVQLKKSNLYKNKVHNPKEKEGIDKIFKQL